MVTKGTIKKTIDIDGVHLEEGQEYYYHIMMSGQILIYLDACLMSSRGVIVDRSVITTYADMYKAPDYRQPKKEELD